MQLHTQLQCPNYPAQCTKCQQFYRRGTQHNCTSESSLAQMLAKAQTDALTFEMQSRQFESRSINAEKQYLEANDLNIRLREAVEELERRLQTSYEQNKTIDLNRQSMKQDGVKESHDVKGEGSEQVLGLIKEQQHDAFAEVGSIDELGEMTYQEKMAYNLEHLAGVLDIIQIKLPNYNMLLNKQEQVEAPGPFGSSAGQRQDQVLQLSDHCNERRGFFFASSDSFGCCKVWELDRRASLFTFNFEEERFQDFGAPSPPPVRCLLQVKHCLVACLSYDESASTIQVYDMISKKEVTQVYNAHLKEITHICSYQGHPGTNAMKKAKLKSENEFRVEASTSALDNAVFVTAGKDEQIKVWELLDEMVRLLYVITLPSQQPEIVTCMCSYEMKRFEHCLVIFCESRIFYIVQLIPEDGTGYLHQEIKGNNIIKKEAPNEPESNPKTRDLSVELSGLWGQQDDQKMETTEQVDENTTQNSLQSSKDNTQNPEDQDQTQLTFEIKSHQVIMKYPSKHTAHTLLQLGQDRLITVSENTFEHWDMQREKRRKLVSTTFGQMLHSIKLTDSYRQGLEPKLLACEDSRILRVFSQRRYTNRIMSRHNDVIRKLLKVPGRHLFLTAADDGSIKCTAGRRPTQSLLEGAPLLQDEQRNGFGGQSWDLE